MSSKIPRGMPSATEAKRGHRLDAKDTASAAQKSDGALKAHKENVPRKNVGPKVHTGVSTRYGQQSELKEQHQQLLAAHEEMKQQLLEMEQKVAKQELQFAEVEKENVRSQKELKDLHVVLVAAKIDPVVAVKIEDAVQQQDDRRKESRNACSELTQVLGDYEEIASRLHAQLEEAQTRMADLAKAREHMMQERQSFSLQAAELEAALQDAETLLL